MALELTIVLEDEKAIAIVEAMSDNERDRIIEQFILLGDTVARYATITASEESFQRFFDPTVQRLEMLGENLLSTRQQLETNVPTAIKAQLDAVITQIQDATASLTTLHSGYNTLFAGQHEMLGKVIPTLAKSSTRGALTNEAIFLSLQESFREDYFEDVSGKARYADILCQPSGALHPVLIELKDYTGDVPSKDVDKFWRDMDARNARVGCFFSMYTRIQTVTSDFCIVPNGDQIGIFLVNEVFNHQGHILAYTVARKLQEMLCVQGGIGSVDKYGFMVKVLNNQLCAIRDQVQDLEQIKNDIEATQQEMDKRLRKVADHLGNLRTRIEGIVDDVFRDFADELSD
jgi:hypothetical protein